MLVPISGTTLIIGRKFTLMSFSDMAKTVKVFVVNQLPVLFQVVTIDRQLKVQQQAYTLDCLNLDWNFDHTFVYINCTNVPEFKGVARHKFRLCGIEDAPEPICVKCKGYCPCPISL